MSYTLAYTGTQIDDILGRSAPNGEFDGYFADINDKLDKLNIVTTSDDYATVQAYVQNNVAVALSDGGGLYAYAGEYDGNYYFAKLTQGSSDTTDAVYEVAYIDSSNNWYVGGGSALAPVFSPNFTGNPTAPTPIQSSNDTSIATTTFVHSAVDPVSSAALNAYPTDTASGDIVSITDGANGIPVKSFTGSIIPQQNLNGQSAPYPAGGGKNKLNLILSNVFQGGGGKLRAINIDGNVVTLENNGVNSTHRTTNYGFKVYCGYYTAGTVLTAYYGSLSNGTINFSVCQSVPAVEVAYSNITVSASGTGYASIICPSDGYYTVGAYANNTADIVVTNLMVQIGAHTAQAYSPYSNICPISGWTGAKVYRMGVNLCDPTTITDGYRVSNNGNIIVGANNAVTDYIPIKGNTSYYLRNSIGGSSFYSTAVYDENKTFIKNISINGSGAQSGAISTPENARYIRVNMLLANKADFAFNYPSTDHDYHAYNGSTILLDFGSTVYAGTLTALGGGLWKIQPTHAIIDLSTATYTINTQTTGKLFNFAKSDMSRTAGLTGWAEAYQQSFVSAARDMPDYSFLIRSDANAVLVRTDGTETTLPTGNLVYPLATLPDPITITGEDLQTLLGANTVWTDVGSVTGMTYRADTALYIDKKLGA